MKAYDTLYFHALALFDWGMMSEASFTKFCKRHRYLIPLVCD